MENLYFFVDKLFDLAVIERWNDHPRPFNITELDKQSHKAIIAFLLARMEEEEKGIEINWKDLIDGLIFEALQRAVLTDIKPTLFHKLIKNKKEKINEFVLKQYSEKLSDINEELFEKMKNYFEHEEFLQTEKRIISAAHYLATYWEFQFIYKVASDMYGIEETKKEIENKLEDFYELIGVQKFSLGKKSYGFIDLCGQLRFQKRWIQTVRIPETSVLGHVFMVASLVYFILNNKKDYVSDSCIVNTFFTALFHDLPEIVTRDIVSGIKEVFDKKVIKQIEIEETKNRIIKLLPSYIARDIEYYLDMLNGNKDRDENISDEFSNRILKGEEVKKFDNEEKFRKDYCNSEYKPVWGSLVKECDITIALAEAVYSIKHGLISKELKKAAENMYKKLIGKENVGELVKSLYSEIK